MKFRLFFFSCLLLPLFLAWGLSAENHPVSSFEGVVSNQKVVRAYFYDPGMVTYISSWKAPWEVNYKEGYLVVDASPEEIAYLENLGYRVEVDTKLSVLLQRPAKPLPNQLSGIPGYACYRTVEETLSTIQTIVAEHPTLATAVDIGNSWKKTQNPNLGYDLMVLKLTNSAVPGPKPIFFAMSAIHAREYTTAELNTRFAEYLVNNYGIDADVTWLLDHHEIHLLLQSNPDGRKQAETGLTWRKNTNENYCGATSTSRGADLNRNFAFEWGAHGGSSGTACSETYRGPSAASEPEVQAVQNYNLSIFPDWRDDPISAGAPLTATGAFVDIHSYSQLVLWPWGFDEITGNDTQFQTFGRKLAYFNEYTPQQAVDLYVTDGTTDDFIYGELGVAAFTFELGTAFFQSCASFESTIYPDNLEALIYMAKAVRAPYMLPAGPDSVNVALSDAVVTSGESVVITAQANDIRYENGNGTEPSQNISAAEYYVNTPYWSTSPAPVAHPMAAVDGSFNQTVENVTATLDTTGLPSGRHTIFVRSRDAAGNWGVVSAQFLYVIDPEVAPVLEGVVRNASNNEPVEATINLGGPFQTSSDPTTGAYQLQLPSNTYDVEVSAAGFAPQTVNNIVLEDGETVQQNFNLTPVCAVWSDDVEGGTNGWTAQAPWAITTESSHSPTHSWTESPGSNYGDDRNISITSPILDLTGASNLQLNFWHTCETEAGWDYCIVEASPDGTNWSELARYDGVQNVWEAVSLDASLLDNQATARIRFRFTSDGSVVEDGWHIDDIQLVGAGAQCGLPLPTAGFTSSSPDYVGETTIFTNTSANASSYEWDFGDGSGVSTAENPTYSYPMTGTYTVVLTATGQSGTTVFSDTVEILPVPEVITAGFTSSSPDFLGETTVFTDTSAGAVSYLWDFGDGTPTSTLPSPTHTYGVTGTFTVTLTIFNGDMSDTVQHSVTIVPVVVGDFRLFLPVIQRD